MQRGLLSARERFVLAMCGRQVGKTDAGARWVAGARRGLVLVPTHRSGVQGAYGRLRELLDGTDWTLNKNDGEWTSPDKRVIYLRSCDRPDDAIRGCAGIDRVWVDECTLVRVGAWDAALPAQLASLSMTGRKPQTLLTGTTMGKGHWTYRKLWEPDRDDVGRYRVTSYQAPFLPDEELQRIARGLSPTMAAQELGAEFVDDELIPFTPELVAAMFPTDEKGRPIAVPVGGVRCSMGLDIARTQDWSVTTIMDELGRFKVTKRWKARMTEREFYQPIFADLQRLGPDSLLVLDLAGGYGGSSYDRFSELLGYGLDVPPARRPRIVGVNTNNPMMMASLVHNLELSAPGLQGEHPGTSDKHLHAILWDELLRVTGEQKGKGAEKVVVFPGPHSGSGLFNDCFASFALAAHGQKLLRGLVKPDPLAVDHSGFFGAM